MNSSRLKIRYFAALALLLASLLAMGSATWAWFARNDLATAEGMQVRVKAEGSYLLIAPGALDADGVQALRQNEASALTASATLYPAAHGAVSSIDQADAPANWYYRTSFDPASYGGDGNETGMLPLPDGKYAEYVLANAFSITVADGANPVEKIKVQDCTISSPDAQAVRVLVATSEAAEEFSGVGDRGQTILSAAGVTAQTTLLVKVYLYWYGADTDVFSNNLDRLRDTTVEVVFAGEPVEQ